MKRLVWVLTLLLLLTACKSGGETAASPSSPPAPTASFTPEPTSDPDAPWWERLTAGDLPTALAAAEDLSGTGEQCFMLGHLKDPDISLYGVAGEDVVLLRRGETLAAFEQVYRAQPQAVLPELWWMDLDGDGAEELAVRYLRDADEDHLVYDLHIYAWDGQRWSDCAVTKDACADRVLSQVEVRRENGSVTLSYGRTSAVYQLPQGSGAGRLVLDSGFFRCQDGVFTVVLGARVDQLSHFANVLADIDYTGGSFTLRNLRVEPTMGV